MTDARDEAVVGPSTRAPADSRAPERGREFVKSARVRIIKGQLKEAEATSDESEGKRFAFYCDEPPSLGGADEYPQPLTYVAAGIGF